MHGDSALKLVQESRRSISSQTFLKYNDPLTRHVALETRQLGDSIAATTSTLTSSQGDALRRDRGLICDLTVRHLSARRNKRCLMAYHMQRVEMLKEMYWDVGGALAHLLSSPINTSGTGGGSSSSDAANGAGSDKTVEDLRSRLSPQEVDFLRAYNDLVLDYKSDFLDLFDLTSSIAQPPPPAGELFVDVVVVRECGAVYTETGGLVEFRKGQRYMVRRSDVERLIVQGFLQEM